tara:strand:+ start:5407 stop:5787 length:381 start_codon:yes stop_codon:yes gene_type:complete
MAILKTTIDRIDGNPGNRVVQTESLLQGNAGTVNGASFEVPKGSDFVAFINTAAVNTAGAITTDLEGSFDGATWVDINASFAADCDTALVRVAYVAATSGDFPFYRLTFDAAANDAATTLTYKITH